MTRREFSGFGPLTRSDRLGASPQTPMHIFGTMKL